MDDRRSVKTKRAIREAFLELLKHKSINRISVVEISNRADLGRGTFYLHYKDVYDLMEHLENELISNLEKLYDASFPFDNSMNMLKLTDTITEYLESNRETFLLLSRTENGSRILEKLRQFFIKKLLSDNGDAVTETDTVEAVFIVSGVLGVLETWLRDGIKTSHKSISELLHHELMKFDD